MPRPGSDVTAHPYSQVMSGQSLGQTIDRFLDDTHHAVASLKAYYGTSNYTGRHYDDIGGGGLASPNEITTDDLVALALLAVPVGGRAAQALLFDRRQEVGGLLEQIDARFRLWDESDAVDEAISKGGAANELWSLLLSSAFRGLGEARVNKLLARKRPNLLPVWDSVIQEALAPPRRGFWRPMRSALVGDDGRRRLCKIEELRTSADLSADLSPLRILDVVVWMRNHGAAQVEAHRHLHKRITPGSEPTE